MPLRSPQAMQNDYRSTHSGERDPKHTMWPSIWSFLPGFIAGEKFTFLPNKAILPRCQPDYVAAIYTATMCDQYTPKRLWRPRAWPRPQHITGTSAGDAAPSPDPASVALRVDERDYRDRPYRCIGRRGRMNLTP